MKVSIRPIEYKDIEKLRIWRNKNKNAFFYNKIIKKEEQIKWFNRYLKHIDNQIYIVEYLGKSIGCIGYRPFGEFIELYNVMLSNKEYERHGLMSKALQLLLKKIKGKVIVRLVKDNKKALAFYIKNGFKEVKHDIGIWLESR